MAKQTKAAASAIAAPAAANPLLPVYSLKKWQPDPKLFERDAEAIKNAEARKPVLPPMQALPALPSLRPFK